MLSALLLALPVPALAAPGDLDPSFDGDGKVLTDFRGFDFATALVVQPDHKLVAAGEDVRVGSSRGALARYNPDGSLDRSFGGDGRVRLNFGGGIGPPVLVLQPDGKLVVTGSAGEIPLPFDVLLARLNPNGSLDTSFGAGGIVQTDFGRSDTAFALVLQPDGKLVVAGESRSRSIGVDLILARYHPDGSLDASFGAGGIVVVENSGGFAALLLQPDGKLVAAVGGQLFRFNPDGTLDTSFGDGGRVGPNFGGPSFLSALVLQSDGKHPSRNNLNNIL